mmetsp:Transcript_12500/g.16817  ORF Transcript_12500/g.16817 Transcript_12500/m.16817 type:complete len:647 (+) Transcript_12500:780-2720(+)
MMVVEEEESDQKKTPQKDGENTKNVLVEEREKKQDDCPDETSYENIFNNLEAIGIPIQATRRNVTRVGDTPPRGLVLGAVNVRGHGGIQLTIATREHEELSRLLARFFRAHCPDPDFTYTTIQINYNYQAQLHVDRYNLGPSYIVGLGDWKEANNISLSEDIAGMLWVYGRGALDCRKKWIHFDGNVPHQTLPFSGTRYTLIYFTHCSQSMLPKSERTYLTQLGFPLPDKNLIKAPHMRTAEERLIAARLALDLFLTRNSNSNTVTEEDYLKQKEEFLIDGIGNRPCQRIAIISTANEWTAPELKRYRGKRLRKQSELSDDESKLAQSSHTEIEKIIDGALIEDAVNTRPKFIPWIESWERNLGMRKEQKNGAKFLAKYAGLSFVDDDPYDANYIIATCSDAVIETERQRALCNKNAIEHRIIFGIEWCRFARHWTALTRLRNEQTFIDDSSDVEKYPIDDSLIKMILASPYNIDLDFFGDIEQLKKQRSEYYTAKHKVKTGSSSKTRSDAAELPSSALIHMIQVNLKIIINQNNPKSGKSAIRYEKYKYATDCKSFINLGGSRADLRNDLIRDHIHLADGSDWRQLSFVLQALQERALIHPEEKEEQLDENNNCEQHNSPPISVQETTFDDTAKNKRIKLLVHTP